MPSVPDGANGLHHGGDFRRIEARQHFIQQQEIRAGRQGPGHLQAFLLGHVEAPRGLIAPVQEIHLSPGTRRPDAGPP